MRFWGVGVGLAIGVGGFVLESLLLTEMVPVLRGSCSLVGAVPWMPLLILKLNGLAAGLVCGSIVRLAAWSPPRRHALVAAAAGYAVLAGYASLYYWVMCSHPESSKEALMYIVGSVVDVMLFVGGLAVGAFVMNVLAGRVRRV